jgi:hypothetical protein
VLLDYSPRTVIPCITESKSFPREKKYDFSKYIFPEQGSFNLTQKHNWALFICIGALLSIFTPTNTRFISDDIFFWLHQDVFAMMVASNSSASPTANISNVSNNNFLIYENFSSGVKINYPDDWERIQGVENTTVTFLSPQRSVFTITVKNFSHNVTLDQYSSERISELNQTYNITLPIGGEPFKIIQSVPIELSGPRA